MNRARMVARDLMTDYYKWCRQGAPPTEALDLISVIRLRDNRWQHHNHRKRAEQIFEAARFDVDELAENFLGLTLSVEPMHRLDAIAGATVFGAANPRAGEIRICERAEAYPPLYRTTVMHEVAHVLMHGPQDVQCMNYSPDSPRRPRHEMEADEFMHTTILPVPVLNLVVAWIADLRGASLPEALARANTRRGRWQWRHLYLPAIINTLCVSRHLIAIKLVTLGVFSRATLKYHLSYAAPNCWRPEVQSLGPTRSIGRIIKDMNIPRPQANAV